MSKWICLILLGFLSACTSLNQANISNANRPKNDMSRAAELNVKLGLGYLAQGQIARAKSKLIHAYELQPSSARVQSALAFFWEQVGDINEAEISHQKAIRLNPLGGDVYNNYGAYLCRQAKFEEADRAFMRSIQDKKYSRIAEVYENAGICARQAQQPKKAKHYLDLAITRDRERVRAYFELAQVLFELSDYQGSLEKLASFHQLGSPTAASIWLKMRNQKYLGNPVAWSQGAKELKNLFPQSSEYRAYLKTEKF